VTGTRENISINGLDISGIGQSTGNGIHFGSAITDVTITNNKIHDLTGSGLFFPSTPVGSHQIQGNLFQRNGGVGISNAGPGATTIDATYNSWGDPGGPTALNGDGVSANVSYDPWTYVKVYMESSGTFWQNVGMGPNVGLGLPGEQITYTFYADLVNASSLDFTFAFPFFAMTGDPDYCWWAGCAPIYKIFSDMYNRPLRIAATNPNTADFEPTIHSELLDTATNFGYVNFAGQSKSGMMTATKKELYSVVFDVRSAGLPKPLPFFDEVYEIGISDVTPIPETLGSRLFPDFNRANFGMLPPAGPSNNVFASAMVDGTFKGINFPNTFATGSTLNNYYQIGVERQFNVNVTNPPKGGAYGAHLRFKLTGAELADVTSMKMETAPGVWTNLTLTVDGSNLIANAPTDSIAISPGSTGSYNFRAVFAKPGTYPVEINLVFSAQNYVMSKATPAPGFVVAPVITSATFGGPYEVGVVEDVSLNITNPGALVGPFSLVFDYPTGTTIEYNSNTYNCTSPCDPIPVNLPNASNDLEHFLVTIPIAYTGPIQVSLYDTAPPPDQLLAVLEETITTDPKPSVTVTVDAGQSKVYGEADPVFTFTSSVPGLTFTGALSRDTGEDVGMYAVTIGDLAVEGYDITFVSDDFEITPRPITVTADDQSKAFGEPDPLLTYSITDGSLVFSDTFTGNITRQPGETAGTYAILQGTLALSANYNLTFVEGVFTIQELRIFLPMMVK